MATNGSAIDVFSQDISRLVFRASIRRDMGQVSLSSGMIEVLRELDGTKDTLAVSRFLGMSMNDLRDILTRLSRLELIERVEGRREIVDRGYLPSLRGRLADVMGPMAEVLIRDEITKMGEELDRFPRNRTTELIERLASKIFVESKKETFLRTVKGE